MRAFAAILLLSLTACGGKDPDDLPKKTTSAPVAPDNDGPGVTLKPDAQALAGIRTEALGPISLQTEQTAYGKLEEDPSEAFVVRAPIAGTLRAAGAWPTLGQTLAKGFMAGRVEPRLSPGDAIGLNTQLSAARSELNGTTASVAAARIALDRARTLNADNKNVADRVVEEAAARLAAEQARAKAAGDLIATLENSLRSPAAIAVTADAPGDVVEILAHPGETVEQGAALLRLARFDRLLARIEFPAGEAMPGPRASAGIVPAGSEDRPPIPATSIGPAPQGTALLFRLSSGRPALRPGASVTARIALAATAGAGVLIPRAAVVQQDGRLWAYVLLEKNRFERRPVPSDHATAAGFLVSRGFSPGDRIAVTGAQSLLSEEFKSRNEADTN